MSEVSQPLVFTSQSQALENEKAQLKALLERREQALRLYENPDFRKLVIEGFFVEDCARYARESADPALTPEARADALAMAQAAGHFKRFLWLTAQMGAKTAADMAELEEALIEVRAEEGAI